MIATEPHDRDGLAGRTLGEFLLRERIGEGSFGVVYLADQPALQRQAVIKIQKLAHGSTPGAVERFLSEARLASRIDHPFAAHIYGFGAEPDGLLWIAMELVRGTPLRHMLADEGPLPLARAIPLLRRLCEVVQTAHDHGVVHRDLKPENIMVLSRAGSLLPKLLDLGVARDRSGGESTHAAGSRARGVGTPHYMAPELWVDPAGAGPAADVYALGVIAFELLTGERPFPATGLLELAVQHADAALPPLPDALPRALGDAIAHAMAKRVAERTPTALAFANALADASGIATDGVGLPSLDEATRDAVILRAAQPIAEIVSALDSAQNPHQAREALWEAVDVIVSYVGVLALSCRARAGPGRHPDSAEVERLVHQLQVGRLSSAQWWQLSRELCRPFALIPAAHPLPELVGLMFERTVSLRTAMDELIEARNTEPGATAPVSSLREFLCSAVPLLSATLRSLRFLEHYRLVVPMGDRLELWMGVRRSRRQALASRPTVPVDGPVLVDGDGNPVVSLSPLAQAMPPSPDAPAELFVFAGRGRRGARLIASPMGFERVDPTLPDWVARQLPAGPASPAARPDLETPPYRGLAPFTAQDVDSFLGREHEVDAFCNRLRTTALLAVIGVSGAGKSSFIQAGVLPTIAEHWRSLIVRPGPRPMSALAATLRAAGFAGHDTLSDPDQLGRVLGVAAAAGRGIVLVVDQFEELFTLCLDQVERDLYARALARAARADQPVRIIFTLRDDFLARAAGLPLVGERFASGLQVLTTPALDDLRRILVEPARRTGYEFEDLGLVDEMVREVEAQSGALALLSFTAFQLWEFRDRQGKRLTRKAYRALGGVGGALAQHAEATLAELAPAEQQLVREAFRHLVTAEGTRIAMSRADLIEVAGSSHAERVLEKLTSARLLTAMEGPDGAERIEIVHEALLSAWPRMVRWRQEEVHGARLRDQLRVAAQQWSERGRGRGLLWRGAALAEYRLWRTRYPGNLTETEEAFGRASVGDAARGRRLRLLALAAVIAGLSIGLFVVAQLRSAAEASRARAQSRLVESFIEQGRRALLEDDTPGALLFLEQALAGGADGPALRYMLARALEPLDTEVATLRGHTGPLWGVAFFADGRRVLTWSEDGTAIIWSVSTRQPEHVLRASAGKGRVVAQISPDGETVATGGGDGQVELWDAVTGTRRSGFAAHACRILGLRFSPDGRRLVTTGVDGSVRIWDVVSRSLVSELIASDAMGDRNPEVAPNTDRIAVGSEDRTATVWDWHGRLIARLSGHRDRIWYAVPDPSGRRVATTSLDNTARIWDAETGAVIHVLRGHDQRVTDVAWSPDGQLLATASADLSIKVWDAAVGEVKTGLLGHTGQVNQVEFTAAGRELVSVAADGTARVWDPVRGLSLATLNHGGFVFGMGMSRDGSMLATASWLGTAKLWRMSRKDAERSLVSTHAEGAEQPEPMLWSACDCVTRFAGNTAEVWWPGSGRLRRFRATSALADVALAGATGRLAMVSDDGRLRVVDIADDRVRIDGVAHERGAGAVALEAGGDRLVTTGADGTLALWDVASGREIVRRPVPALIDELVWSPGGDVIVAIERPTGEYGNGRLIDGRSLRDVAELGPIRRVEFSPRGAMFAVVSGVDESAIEIRGRGGQLLHRIRHKALVGDVVFTPAGDQLLVGLVDGGIQAWSATDWKTLGRIDAHDLMVRRVAVSADGALGASVGLDSMVKTWDMATLRLLHQIRVAPATQWVAFGRDGERLLIAGSGHIDVRSASRNRLSLGELERLLRCRLPFRLEGATVVPIDQPVRCE